MYKKAQPAPANPPPNPTPTKPVKLDSFQQREKTQYNEAVHNALQYGLIGAGVGGLGLGLNRWLESPEGEDPKARRAATVRQALLGALLGGTVGAGLPVGKYLQRDRRADPTVVQRVGRAVSKKVLDNPATALAGVGTAAVQTRGLTRLGPYAPLSTRLSQALERAIAKRTVDAKEMQALFAHMHALKATPGAFLNTPPVSLTLPDIATDLAAGNRHGTLPFGRAGWTSTPPGGVASVRAEYDRLQRLTHSRLVPNPVARVAGGPVGGLVGLAASLGLGQVVDQSIGPWRPAASDTK